MITTDQKTRFGKPIITGTRIPVAIIVGKIAGGMTIKDVMKDYRLTKNQVNSALRYAADIVASEEVSYV